MPQHMIRKMLKKQNADKTQILAEFIMFDTTKIKIRQIRFTAAFVILVIWSLPPQFHNFR